LGKHLIRLGWRQVYPVRRTLFVEDDLDGNEVNAVFPAMPTGKLATLSVTTATLLMTFPLALNQPLAA